MRKVYWWHSSFTGKQTWRTMKLHKWRHFPFQKFFDWKSTTRPIKAFSEPGVFFLMFFNCKSTSYEFFCSCKGEGRQDVWCVQAAWLAAIMGGGYYGWRLLWLADIIVYYSVCRLLWLATIMVGTVMAGGCHRWRLYGWRLLWLADVMTDDYYDWRMLWLTTVMAGGCYSWPLLWLKLGRCGWGERARQFPRGIIECLTYAAGISVPVNVIYVYWYFQR